jgi:hypothetical protein
MFKLIKKIILSCLSVLGLSFVVWLVLLMNPSLSYAHQTQFGPVTVYHQQDLPAETAGMLDQSIHLIRESELYDEDIRIDLCLNDGSFYPELWPYKGLTAYSFMNKTVIYRSEPDFAHNYTEWSWAVNHYERRRWKLTELLAHEFIHVLQYQQEKLHTLKYDHWKIEGYAEYVSRKERGPLLPLVRQLAEEQNKQHNGIPWITFADGTGTSLMYLERWLVVGYLMEEKGMSYRQILDSTLSFDDIRSKMLAWAQALETVREQ